MFFSFSLFAQSTTSHRILIHVVSINQFNIHQDISNQQSMEMNQDQSEYNVNWTISKCNKNIIASIPSINENEFSTFKINDVPIKIHNHGIDITPDILEKRGHMKLKYMSSNVHTHNLTICLTMTEK